jgi:hypothetical protein
MSFTYSYHFPHSNLVVVIISWLSNLKKGYAMIKLQNTIAIVATLGVLTACGSSTRDRALSGAGIGAGTGAVGAAVLGGNPVKGAVIGGAVGAATGGLTKQEDLDLGKPVWQK